MKAIAVRPGHSGSVHLARLDDPTLDEILDGQGVLARVLAVGVDATDREINAAEYGAAPPGADFLVLGHESLCRVEQIGSRVASLAPGDLVVFMVRRPGRSIYDQMGLQDMTTDDRYFERGISLLHGFLTERVVDHADYAIKLPETLGRNGVLLEPTSVVEKAIRQAYTIQQRLGIWRPRRAIVLGAGPLGLLATMALRLRSLEVVTFARSRLPNLNGELAQQIGARYVSAQDSDLKAVAAAMENVDLIVEATGYSPLVFEAMEWLGRNGVLVLTGIAAGSRTADAVHADHILQGFVLGNKVVVGSVNAAHMDFEQGASDLVMTEALWPGWLGRLLTHRVDGLDRYDEMMRLLTEARDAIKIYVDVAGA